MASLLDKLGHLGSDHRGSEGLPRCDFRFVDVKSNAAGIERFAFEGGDVGDERSGWIVGFDNELNFDTHGRPSLAEIEGQPLLQSSAADVVSETSARAGEIGASTMATAKSAKTSDAGGQNAVFSTTTNASNYFDNDALRLLRSVHSVSPISAIRIVPANVKQFASDFRQGASDPEAALREAATFSPELVNAWRMTPPEKRLFIAGAGEDTAAIDVLRHQLGQDGYGVFFYKFCVKPSGQLCPSATTGAFFKTAGQVLFLDSVAASNSRYVAVELDTAQRIQRGQRQLILVTPVQVLALAGAPAIGAIVFVASDTE